MANTCTACGARPALSPLRAICDACVARVSAAVLDGADHAPQWPWKVRTQHRDHNSDAIARTHLDLGLAYLQMGLLPDALVETALAVVLHPVASVIEEAWPVLTDARLGTDVNAITAFAKVLSLRGTA